MKKQSRLINHFLIVNHGSFVGFAPQTEEAGTWWKNNVRECTKFGSQFFVKLRFSGAILHALKNTNIEGIQLNETEKMEDEGDTNKAVVDGLSRVATSTK